MSGQTITEYAFDPTGTNPANLIQGELQAITGGVGHDYYFIIPELTPYFAESLIISYKSLTGEVRTLTNGIDFYNTHEFIGATRGCAKAIYGSITFLNLALQGTVTLQYQTLGGDWLVDDSTIETILADQLHNPRTTSWDQVAGYPTIFPPIDHEWDLIDMVGMSDVVNVLNDIANAIIANGASISTQHINDFNNPHRVTPAQIGAVTTAQLNAAVQQALLEAGAGNSDNITEGTTNLFFTQARVLATPLTGLTVGSTGENRSIAANDAILAAFGVLQTQINNKVDMNVPVFKGIAADTLVLIAASTTTTSIDISQAGAYRATLTSSTAFQFNTSFVKNAQGNVVEFGLTVIQDPTGGRAVSWPANVKWAGGVTPPATTTANGQDSYYFYSEDNMASWVGSLSIKAAA